ncbi:hypothetical protein DFH08DRAFT_1087853 [Mycena albidolilacea]|uniref:Uncharacterized protein n=1 Tax=Mycena albidolilacea TaxID=1033008 RepID=A0AAD6Z7S6_9AGAR|nr:hypothetical protein DFH08DRAFT_1087853 [Mycena albidolilacea]
MLALKNLRTSKPKSHRPTPGLKPLVLIDGIDQAAQVGKGTRLLQRLRLKKKNTVNVSSVYILVTGEDALETDTAAHTPSPSLWPPAPLRRMVPRNPLTVDDRDTMRSSSPPRRLSSLFIHPVIFIFRTVPVFTKTPRVLGNPMASPNSAGSGLRPLRLSTGLAPSTPQPPVHRSPLYTTRPPRPSRIPRFVGHHRSRTSSPRSTCALCGARAPSSPPRAVSGVSYGSDVTAVDVSPALDALANTKVDEPALEGTMEKTGEVNVEDLCPSAVRPRRTAEVLIQTEQEEQTPRPTVDMAIQTKELSMVEMGVQTEPQEEPIPAQIVSPTGPPLPPPPPPPPPPVKVAAPGIKIGKGPAVRKRPTDVIKELTDVIARRTKDGTIRPPRQVPPTTTASTSSTNCSPSTLKSTLRPWKEKENAQSELKAAPWSWNPSPKAKDKVNKKADTTKVAATSRTRMKARETENDESEAKAAAVKNWRRSSPKANKMAEPKEEGELVKLFRQQKGAGGRRVPLGAVDTNVASSSASTYKQGARWPKKIFVPPVVEGSVPSRNPRIAAEIAGLRALEKVRGGAGAGV